MKIFKKILLWLAAIPLLLIASVVVVQTYYALTPVPLSKQAEELNARAAKLPTVTENGYRLNGLLAPAGQDPVVYGKCIAAADEQRTKDPVKQREPAPSPADKPAWDAYWKPSSDRAAESYRACLSGGLKMAFPKALTEGKIKGGMPLESWSMLADAVPDAELIARAELALTSGPRRMGAEMDSPIPTWSTLIAYERWRIAGGVVSWDRGDKARAVAGWARDIRLWAASAHESLIGAMIAAAAQTQAVLAMQNAAARTGKLDESVALAALAALVPVEEMPRNVADSMIAEWQLQSSMPKRISDDPSLTASLGLERNVWARAYDRLGAWTFEHNDTLNRLAQANIWSRDAIHKGANGKELPMYPPEWEVFGCTTEADWGLLCLPFMRNSTGRILVAVGAPQYASYGTRVADLRNLASATRLTIEARRRGLSGDALPAFVANAPADMRDVFTGKPFEYDAAKKELRPVLREKNTVLGEKGPYALPL